MPQENHASTIASAMRRILGFDNKTNDRVVECKVISVNEDERTCIADSISENMDGIVVRLTPEICDGDVCLPEIDSTIMVHMGDNKLPYMVGFTFLDQKTMIVGDQMWEMTSDKQVLNSDEFGGIPKVIELTKKYNALEKDLNNLKDAFKNVLTTIVNEAGNGAPSSFQASMISQFTTYFGAKLTETKRGDIENTAIVHGEKIK